MRTLTDLVGGREKVGWNNSLSSKRPFRTSADFAKPAAGPVVMN